VGVPLVLVLVPACWLLLTRLSPGVPRELPGPEAGAPGHAEHNRRPRPGEVMVMVIFFATALAWITHAPISIGGAALPLTGWDGHFAFGGARSFVSDGTIAIAAALLLFLLPAPGKRGDRLLTWEFAAPRLPWGALLLFGGGLALAQALETGGVTAYLTAGFGALAGVPLWLIVLLVILAVTVVSELASNTASAAMAIPVLASLAAALDVDPGPLLMAAALGASCGYALPVATPPNTIVYATGEVNVSTMIRAGAILDLIAAIAMYAAVMLLARLVL
jgi:sodium-dependent dicarboxylate transporter 2/3/5